MVQVVQNNDNNQRRVHRRQVYSLTNLSKQSTPLFVALYCEIISGL